MSLRGSTNAEKIWNFCKDKGMNDYGCAAVVGNADIESGLNPNNLQDTYNRSLGMTDIEYVNAVDNGSYTKEQFVRDCAGFGGFQWTWWERKEKLYDFWKSFGGSIGSLEMQMNFFYKELIEGYTSLSNTLKTAKSVSEASNAFMLQYECPYDQSISAQNKRTSFAQKYYDLFVTNKQTNQNIGSDSVMGYKNTKKGNPVKLSNNFNSTEFDCHGSGCCSQTVINETLVQYLQKIREHFGKPITITSGYRCPTHNKRVGGATGSRHSKGDAADIVVSGVSPREVAKYAESIGIKGIGLYETNADGHFTHIDTRTTKSFWYGQSEAYRSTFGGSNTTIKDNANNNVTTNNTNTSNTTNSNVLSVGSSGNKVKKLQQNLIKLGYSCGKSKDDGDFGAATKLAVQEFQKEYGGLSVDGIAGSKTLTAIENSVNSNAFRVKITADILNVRSGAGMNYKIVANIKKNSTYLMLKESDGWGKISKGWISSKYYKKL